MATLRGVAIAPGEDLSLRLDALRRRRGPGVAHFSAKVRDVVVLASSSRGGSSMLAEMLRASSSLVHLQAEINPFLRLVGLAFPTSGTNSDELRASHADDLGPEARKALDED